ncbi:Response regulator containing a CheY-like receiver domain and an HD-GYP domain [Candidatus Desulfosporosinus infrequens]|uniref:Stage 0 sporulation protein A homolog n=1 Tax=Candidatus Desulfosporosinus infrequens TaxID=2043169 RepID=A0A2U3LYT1_9FIRM|nr:Response regulator containing a CheY-like receiver domain and an HD-GYP domain [Candidatus Desulfosporosinus infrequens]
MSDLASNPSLIMIVDDTPQNLKLLENMLGKEGYLISAFLDGAMALKAATKKPPDLILLDINMPDMNGHEVCERLKSDQQLADIPIIFLSAMSEVTDKVRAFQCGGVDYITKPFQFEEVHARVETHLKIRQLQKSLAIHNNNLQSLVDVQIKEILATKEALFKTQLATILAFSKLAEIRDDETGQHIERTRLFCRILTEQLRRQCPVDTEIDNSFVDNIYYASSLHDIGKVAISDKILLKPGRLTAEEFEIMKTHTVVGAKTLRIMLEHYPENAFIKMAVEISLSHHEKWDGSGYPQNLKGPSIPLSARIMALADVYDALTSERRYKAAFSHARSRNIILEGRSTHFDPAVVDAFLVLENQFRKIKASSCDLSCAK